MSIKKHPQFILSASQEFFANHPVFQPGVNAYMHKDFLQQVQSHLVIREREYLEQAPAYRQLLPYLIVRQIGADGVRRYLPYQRTNKVGESRLAGNISIGYGGHIDAIDVRFTNNSVISLLQTIIEAAQRELLEELKVISGNQYALKDAEIKFADLFILDDSNEVGRVHVGIVMAVDIPVGTEVACAEEELISMPFQTADELLFNQDANLENWSRLILEKDQGE